MYKEQLEVSKRKDKAQQMTRHFTEKQMQMMLKHVTIIRKIKTTVTVLGPSGWQNTSLIPALALRGLQELISKFSGI